MNRGWLAAKSWQLPNGDVDSVPEVHFDGLAGRTLGILGVGEIGSRVARLASAFGMTVQGLARRPDDHALAAGAALDTLQHEPPAPDHPLLGRPDVLLTPHTAWLTHESWRRTLAFGFANVARFRTGQPLHGRVQPGDR